MIATIVHVVLIVGLIAGVITNGVLYGQIANDVANVTSAMSNSTVSPFMLLIAADSPERFPILENVGGVFFGYRIVTSLLGVEVTMGGAAYYVNGTLGYAKIGVNNVFPAEYPYTMNQPSPLVSTIADQVAGFTYASLASITVEPNGYDVLFEFLIPPNAPSDGASNIITFMPITIFKYPK